MGIFSTSSPFDQYVERATSEKYTTEDWGQIMDVCDKVKENTSGPKDCMKSIMKRLGNDNPRVVLQTITLLDACINNCEKRFRLEVAGREFEQELNKLITSSKTHQMVAIRLRECLKKWAEGDFKGDPELGLIPALYNKLQKEGYDFDVHSDPPKKSVKYSSDPNVVNNQQEEEDIAKAIQLSLQDSGSNSVKSNPMTGRTGSSGLYSSASAALSLEPEPTPVEKEPIKVRALYDFEAVEDNELTFKAGEIIIVTDDSYSNWWKGNNHRGEGLFPSNFVTKDLDEDIEPFHKSEHQASNKRVSFSECVEVTEVEDSSLDHQEEVTGEINEDKIDQLLHLLHEADPTGERSDDPSLALLEDQVNAMAPSIDAELERIDKKHAQLARNSTDLVEALNLYHQLMREMPAAVPYSFYKGMPNHPPPGMVPPPHFMGPGPTGMPPHSAYLPAQMPPGYVVAPMGGGGPPQYLPPHLGSPTHGANPSYQQFPPSSQGVPSMTPYADFGRIPTETPLSNSEGQENSSGNMPPMNMPSHGVPPGAHGLPQVPPGSAPHTMMPIHLVGGPLPLNAPPMGGHPPPPVSIVSQSSAAIPPQHTTVSQAPPPPGIQQGPPHTSMSPPHTSMHQAPPHSSMPQGLPHSSMSPPHTSMHQAPPHSSIHQAPPPHISMHQAPPHSMSQMPPSSMPFYPTSPPPHFQNMQQLL